MATANDIITGALKSLGVLERNESPQGQEAVDALEIFNQMAAGLIHDGIDLEWQTLALADDVPYAEDELLSLRHLLAVHLAPDWDVMPSPVLMQAAGNAWSRLYRQYHKDLEQSVDDAIQPQWNPNTVYPQISFE